MILSSISIILNLLISILRSVIIYLYFFYIILYDIDKLHFSIFILIVKKKKKKFNYYL